MYSKQKEETNPFLVGIAALQAAQVYEVWPENMAAINLFLSLSTQWRTLGMGPSGLDYNVLFARMGQLKIEDQDREWMFEDIRAIEAEALSIINKKD